MDIVGFSGQTVHIPLDDNSGGFLANSNSDANLALNQGPISDFTAVLELAKKKGFIPAQPGQPGSAGNPFNSPEGYTGSLSDWWNTNVALPVGQTAETMVTKPGQALATALDPKWSSYGIYAVLALVIIVAILGLILPTQGD
jgi:hypothetical protein